jgi:hypothetical protein
MKSKTQLISIIVFVLGVVLFLGTLALWFSPGASSTPVVTPSPTVPQAATRTPTPTRIPPTATYIGQTPDATTATTTSDVAATDESSLSPTETIPPPILTVAAMEGMFLPSPLPPGVPSPTPTMAPWELEVLERMQRAHSQSAASVEECREIFEIEPWCQVYWHARHITRPEWEELFPDTVFYLVKYDLYGGEFAEHHNWLAIKRMGDYLIRDDFQLLLGGNHVFVTDENRETIARAFVLMSLPDYLDEEIVFSDWEEGSWPAGFGMHYNYRIKSWTKIQGLKFQWYFLFDEEGLLGVDGGAPERNVGDYIDVPFEELPVPPRQRLKYWRK